MTDLPVELTAALAAGTVGAGAVLLALVRARLQVRRLRARAATAEADLAASGRRRTELTTRLQAVEAEVRHLTGARLPDMVTALVHPHVPVRGPLDERLAGSELDRALLAVLDQVAEAVGKERRRVDAGAQAALRGATTTIQALLYQLQSTLQEMQERYEDPLVTQDLLAADFLNEQALRRIQSAAVLCGAWPGLTRRDSHLADVVVGATSRLHGYERVQVTNRLRDPVGVVSRAVEPVAIALTELIANALHHSHPELPVAVVLQQGNRGVSVIVDDAGVGMHQEEVDRARRLMSNGQRVLLTELGDPVRAGFAVIGQLVRQYGFVVHLETSPYGGVRAIVHIPGDPLLTLLDEDEHPMSPMSPPRTTLTGDMASLVPGAGRARGAHQALGPHRAEEPDADPYAPEVLPRRRRRQPVAAERMPAHGFEADGTDPGAADQDPDEWDTPDQGVGAQGTAAQGTGDQSTGEWEAARSAERWGAFQRGTASGRAAVSGPASPTPPGVTAPPSALQGAVPGPAPVPARGDGPGPGARGADTLRLTPVPRPDAWPPSWGPRGEEPEHGSGTDGSGAPADVEPTRPDPARGATPPARTPGSPDPGTGAGTGLGAGAGARTSSGTGTWSAPGVPARGVEGLASPGPWDTAGAGSPAVEHDSATDPEGNSRA